VGAFNTTGEARLSEGETFRTGPYALTLVGVTDRRVENREELRAQVSVTRDGDAVGVISAGKNRYFARNEQTSNEVGIHTDWLRAEDLMVEGDTFYANGDVFVKARVNPLVNLIWLSGIVFLVGSAVAMWPDAREQARLARRFATASA
jgi:cytochrome c-type biogenesis protein CcmF